MTDQATFKAQVEYSAPSYEGLARVFRRVDERFEYELCRASEPIEACRGVILARREIMFELVCMDKRTGADTALAQITMQGLRPALFEELLAFAHKYPFGQFNFPIAAIGSHCHFGDRVLYAYYYPFIDGRTITLAGTASKWDSEVRFLAVRE